MAVDVARACSVETVAAHGAQQERDTLASAIEQVAIRLGITTGDIPQTGPEVLLLLQEIELAAAHGALAQAQQEQDVQR